MTPGDDHPILSWLDSAIPAPAAGRFGRALVLAPSAGAAAALRRGLTGRRGALLGVDFVTAAGLARQVLALGGRSFATSVPDGIEEREGLRRLLPDSGIGGYAGRFEGALTELLGVVRELGARGPAALPGRPGRAGAEVLRIAAAWSEEFRDRGGRSRWIAAAQEAVATGLGTLPERVLVVGQGRGDGGDAGLTGDIRALLDALADRGVEVAVVPAAAQAPAAAPAAQAPAAALAAAPAAASSPAPAPAVARYDCPHPFAELRLAARLCAAARSRGVPWQAMVVAAPVPAPYLDHLERAFALEGVPLHTAAGKPLIRHHRAAVYLHLARLLFDDAPRSSFLALAGSPLLDRPLPADELAELDRRSRCETLCGTGAEARDFADRLARRLGEASPTVTLLRSVLDAARRLGGDREAEDADGPGRYRSRSGLLEEFASRHLRGAAQDTVDARVHERLQDCLGAIVFAAAHRPSGARYTEGLHELLRTRTVALADSRPGGVHFVTYAEALAYPCARLHLLGLTGALVPGAGPPTTFLDDDDRQAVGLPTTDAVRLAEERRLEELLRHAPDLTLSHHRCDSRGRPQEYTLLGEGIDRVVGPTGEIREPGHPRAATAAVVASGRCPTDLALAHLALAGCTDPAAYRELRGAGPTVADPARVLHRIAELECFTGTTLTRDGDLGAARGARCLEAAYPVTAFWSLGRCPQQFLFERVMGLRPLPEEPDPMSLPRDRIGTSIHTVVEELYREYLADLRESADPATLLPAMLDRARGILDEVLARDTSMLRRGFPGLHRVLQDRWLDGLQRAITADLLVMSGDGSRPCSIEQEVHGELSLQPPRNGTPLTLRLKGKLDRLDVLADRADRADRADPESGERVRIVDFKTGSRPGDLVDPSHLYKGTDLQLVLYALMVQDAPAREVDALEVRSIRPGGGADRPAPRHALEDAADLVAGRGAAGVAETLAILAALIHRGSFAPRPDRHCGSCRFKSACRRFHPPSVQRVESCGEPARADYLALSSKSAKHPVLFPGEERR